MLAAVRYYSNMPAAATHGRSTTSRGDPQQEHDHRRFRADHETIKQNAPAGRASTTSDGKIVIAPDARIAVRLGHAIEKGKGKNCVLIRHVSRQRLEPRLGRFQHTSRRVLGGHHAKPGEFELAVVRH